MLPEMINSPLPFQKNDRSSDLDVKYPHHSAIVIMDNALTRIYLEAISTNEVISPQFLIDFPLYRPMN